MKRILAISDIHGCYDQFVSLLDQVKYNHVEDQLIILGDYTDRGFKNKEVIDKCIELKEQGAITLMGNHDSMFINWLTTDNYEHKAIFLHNGGLATIESYLGVNWIEQGLTYENYLFAKNFILENYTEHIEFLTNNKLYYQIDNHVFVHAGVNLQLSDWKESDRNDFLWIRDEFLDVEHNYEETFIFGHTPTKYLHGSNDIYFGNKKIGIDGGCFFSGHLNCLEIKDGQYKQYNT